MTYSFIAFVQKWLGNNKGIKLVFLIESYSFIVLLKVYTWGLNATTSGLKRFIYKTFYILLVFCESFSLQNDTIITKNDIWDHPYINLRFLFAFQILHKTLCITYIKDCHYTNKLKPTIFCFTSFYLWE